MGVGSQRHYPAALPSGEGPVPIVQVVEWAPGPVRTGAENLPPLPQRDSVTWLGSFFGSCKNVKDLGFHKMRGSPWGGNSCSLLKKRCAESNRLPNNYAVDSHLPVMESQVTAPPPPLLAGRPRLTQVLEVWILRTPDRRECKRFSAKDRSLLSPDSV